MVNDYKTWGESQESKDRRNLIRKQINEDRQNVATRQYKYNITPQQRKNTNGNHTHMNMNMRNTYPTKSSLFTYLTMLFVMIIGTYYTCRFIGYEYDVYDVYNDNVTTREYTLGYTMGVIRTPVLLSSGDKLIRRKMIVDTGASYVLITKSILSKLNMDYIMYPGLCKRVMTSTANGKREACEFTIKHIQYKKCIAKNVKALAYIDDEKDSDDPLLGMSFLNKFKIVLDRGVMRIYC